MHRLKSHIEATGCAINRAMQTFSVCLCTKRVRRTTLIPGGTMLGSGSGDTAGISRGQKGDREIITARFQNGFKAASTTQVR
jgi:hypothetical protein